MSPVDNDQKTKMERIHDTGLRILAKKIGEIDRLTKKHDIQISSSKGFTDETQNALLGIFTDILSSLKKTNESLESFIDLQKRQEYLREEQESEARAVQISQPKTLGKQTLREKGDSKGSISDILKNLFTNPAVIAALAGVAYAMLPEETRKKISGLVGGFAKGFIKGLGDLSGTVKLVGAAILTYFGVKMLKKVFDAITDVLVLIGRFRKLGRLGKAAVIGATIGGAFAIKELYDRFAVPRKEEKTDEEIELERLEKQSGEDERLGAKDESKDKSALEEDLKQESEENKSLEQIDKKEEQIEITKEQQQEIIAKPTVTDKTEAKPIGEQPQRPVQKPAEKELPNVAKESAPQLPIERPGRPREKMPETERPISKPPIPKTGKPQQMPEEIGVGKVSEKYETGGKGSEAVGWDSTGGTSYGKYQLSSKQGTVDEYLDFIKTRAPEAYNRLKSAGEPDSGKDGNFANEWRLLAREGKLGDTEHQFVKTTHYDRAYNQIKNQDLKQQISESAALREVLWSTSVQHGAKGAANIFNKVYVNGMNKEDFVAAVYKERGTKFGKSTEAVRKNVQQRFVSEQRDVYAMIEQDGWKYVPPTADMQTTQPATVKRETAPPNVVRSGTGEPVRSGTGGYVIFKQPDGSTSYWDWSSLSDKQKGDVVKMMSEENDVAARPKPISPVVFNNQTNTTRRSDRRNVIDRPPIPSPIANRGSLNALTRHSTHFF